tara:strand:+ start:3768 stop:3980 length:213 start_codon:yes stop_codon:yes gene_type:complete
MACTSNLREQLVTYYLVGVYGSVFIKRVYKIDPCHFFDVVFFMSLEKEISDHIDLLMKILKSSVLRVVKR